MNPMTKERLIAIEVDANTRTSVDADIEIELCIEIRRLIAENQELHRKLIDQRRTMGALRKKGNA